MKKILLSKTIVDKLDNGINFVFADERQHREKKTCFVCRWSLRIQSNAVTCSVVHKTKSKPISVKNSEITLIFVWPELQIA